jgi:hypothetical protein
MVISGMHGACAWGEKGSDQWRGVCAWVGERKRSVSMGGRAVAISDMVFLRGIALKGGDYNFLQGCSPVSTLRDTGYKRIQTCI